MHGNQMIPEPRKFISPREAYLTSELRRHILARKIAQLHRERTRNINQIGSVVSIVEELLPDIEEALEETK